MSLDGCMAKDSTAREGERVCVEGTSVLTTVTGSLHRKGDVCFELTALSWMGLPPAKLSVS